MLRHVTNHAFSGFEQLKKRYYIYTRNIMSIAIDTNLIYLQNRLGLSADKLQFYQGKTVTEILEAEAASGNSMAVELAQEIMTNVALLMEIFKLADPNNRHMILMNLRGNQLHEFLPLMEEEDLSQGLKFFTQDKLLKMLEKIPPEQLVQTVLELFSQEEVINYLPENQLDKVITDHSIDKNKMLQHLKSIPPEYLAQIIEAATGKECEIKNSIKLSDQIGGLNPLDYRNALTSLQPIQKQELTLALCKENPKLYELVDPHAYTNMINEHKQKPELVKAMAVIDSDEVMKMIKELPNDLMSILVTQLDPETFADHIMKKTPEVIAELLA